MSNEQISARIQASTGQTPPQTPRPQSPTTGQDPRAVAFNEIHRDTKHIATQTDRIAAHLLEGQTTARKHAARTLLAQIEQIARNQSLLISLVEEIHQRLPPAQGQANGNNGPRSQERQPASAS